MLVRLHIRWASLSTLVLAPLLLLILAGAGNPPPVFAQETTSSSADTSAVEEMADADESPAEPGGDNLAGMGSLGVSIVVMKYVSGNELSNGSARPIFHAAFKYVLNDHLVMPLEIGWGWNSYGEGGGYDGVDTLGTLAVLVPGTLGLDYRFRTGKPSVVPRVGVGVGLYQVSVRAGRSQTSRDPVSDKIRKSISPGFYGKLGAEFMLKSTFWLNTDLMVHQVFCADADNYPRGWLDDNTTVVELRVGLNHYFRIRGNDAPAEGDEDDK